MKMLEHYSHIRIGAKRKALDDLERAREEKRRQPPHLTFTYHHPIDDCRQSA